MPWPTDELRAGTPFSDALARHPDEFQPWEIGLLAVGEKNGRMDEAFNDLAEILNGRRTALLNLAARSARPLLIQALTPWIVLAPVGYLAGFPVYLGLALAGFLAMTPAGVLLFSRKKGLGFRPNALPGFSKMLFSRCLAGLVEAGVHPDDAIAAAAKTAGCMEPGPSRPGEPFHARLRRCGVLSNEELAGLVVSEECGRLDEGLRQWAKRTRKIWDESQNASRMSEML